MTMADSIAVMNAGHIEQLGDPSTLYEQPESAFVANFLGQSNLIRASIDGPNGDGTVRVTSHGQCLEVDGSHIPSGATEIWLGVRPEKLQIGPGGGPNRLAGVVSDASFTGVSTQYLVRMPWGQELTAVQQNDGSGRIGVGQDIELSWTSRHGFALDAGEAADAGTAIDDD